MKIQAYRCDCCQKLDTHETMTGISPVRDLFDAYNSYKVILNPERASIHLCTECYYQRVTLPAQIESVANKGVGFDLKRREMWYCLAETCIANSSKKRDEFGRIK